MDRGINDISNISASVAHPPDYHHGMAAGAKMWQSYYYRQAALMVKQTGQTKPSSGHRLFIKLSYVFEAWDQFDHVRAKAILNNNPVSIPKALSRYTDILNILATNNRHFDNHVTAWKLIDLWNNAQRRAYMGFYDDALARIYRLLEWFIQWVIYQQLGWLTSDLPRDAIPTDIILSKANDGKWRAGLVAAWKVALLSKHEKITQFYKHKFTPLYDYLNIRNNSILAHGQQPVSAASWTQISSYVQSSFIPLLINYSTDLSQLEGFLPHQAQLPNQYPKELLL